MNKSLVIGALAALGVGALAIPANLKEKLLQILAASNFATKSTNRSILITALGYPDSPEVTTTGEKYNLS